MRRHNLRGSIAFGLAGTLLMVPILTNAICAQEIEIVDSAITLSSGGRAELWLQLADRSEHNIRLSGGSIEFDGASLGRYGERGPVESAWRDFLRGHAGSQGAEVRTGLLEFRSMLAGWERGDTVVDRDAVRALGDRLDRVFDLGAAPSQAAEEASTTSGADSPSLQIVPRGVGFDFTGPLDRLRASLERLGDTGKTLDDELAMVVHGDYRIPAGREIEGHLALLEGTLHLAGEIEGDVLILDGTLVLADGARIRGNVLQVGGDLELSGEAVIEGEILSDVALAPVATVEAGEAEARTVAETRSVSAQDRSSRRRGPLARVARNMGRAAEGLMGALSTFVSLAVLGVLLVYFAQSRLETISDTVRHEFARSFAMGLAGQVLFFPALLVLAVLVITWPIVPFFVLAVALAGLVGYVAIAHGAGEMFAQRRYRYAWLERLRHSNSYYYVISGFVLLMLPFAAASVLWVLGGTAGAVRSLIVFVACLGSWILVTAGFGSVLLTRAGGRSVVINWSAGPDPAFGDDDPADAPGSPESEPGGKPSGATEDDGTVDESNDA